MIIASHCVFGIQLLTAWCLHFNGKEEKKCRQCCEFVEYKVKNEVKFFVVVFTWRGPTDRLDTEMCWCCIDYTFTTSHVTYTRLREREREKLSIQFDFWSWEPFTYIWRALHVHVSFSLSQLCSLSFQMSCFPSFGKRKDEKKQSGKQKPHKAFWKWQEWRGSYAI